MTPKTKLYNTDAGAHTIFLIANIAIVRGQSIILSTCPAKNQAGCIERVVHHSHKNQKFYLFKIAVNEKCQKPKLTVKVIMVAMATAV